MIKTLIVDDETKAQEALSELVKLYCPTVEIIGTAASVTSGAELIDREKPELVFLDIEMPHENGFDLLKRFEKINFEVIFTTAFDNYALKAIRFSAIDYLLKPVDPDELKESVKKAENRLKKSSPDQAFNYEILLSGLKNRYKERRKILLPVNDGYRVVELNQIVSCSAEGNYTNVVLENRDSVLISKTLKNFEDLLCEESFQRIHNSTIINLNLVKKYIRGEGGYVIMKDNSQYEISRRKKIEFLEKMSSI
jgi:two-component system, LytTR family, response regulator